MIDDPDKVFLLDGIRNGFNLVDDNAMPLEADCSNYASTTDSSVKLVVEEQILNEISNGNYVLTDKRPTLVSALGAIPKPNSNDVRLIHDCSRPIGTSLNDFATKDSVKYQTIEEAVNLSNVDCFYSKIDLKSAYRSVAIHPSNYSFTGLKWKFVDHDSFTYMYDTKLPFGARKSPAIFHRLTQAVRRMMARRGFYGIVVYLDDFLIVSSSFEQCRETMQVLIQLLRKLGFAINWKKVEDPNKIVTFLGIEFNSTNLSLSLPDNKVKDLKALLNEFSDRKRASKRQLQSLAGRLNWACHVVRGGRTYLRRVLDAMNRMKLPHHKAKLSDTFHKDILWWINCLDTFNGRNMFLKPTCSTPVYVDACNTGAGMAFGRDWAYINWVEDWPEIAPMHINFKEALTVVAAARRWGHLWHNSHIIILTDSECTKAMLNKGTTKNELVMDHIRELFWLSVKFNFEFECVHIRGVDNTLSDAISRLHEKGRFLQLEAILMDYCLDPLHPLALRLHMSTKAIHTLLFQIIAWLQRKWSWIKKYLTIDP